MDKGSSYRDSLKATSLFGGVQIYKILIQIIRSKFIALLIGPEGMGITGLLNSTVTLISTCTNLGLSSSSVRNIAEAEASGDVTKRITVISVLKKLIWVTGFLGASVCFCFARYWSEITFGNGDYTLAYRILSINVLLLQITAGNNAILQGIQKYKYLAKANLTGSTIGLFIAIPLYYLFDINAIVPVLLLSELTACILSVFYAKKADINNAASSFGELKSVGGNMAKMGILISLQSILSILAAYVLKIYIRKAGDIADVGLFNAGFTIVNTYVGLVFTAMATDYYPRLSRVAGKVDDFNRLINNQAEIAIIILAPIITIFICFAQLAIVLLYSSKFMAIETMIYWAMAAIIFKAMAWSMSYSLLAKGDSKLFFWNEFTVVAYGFVLNIIGYKSLGLTGLGISSLIKYIIYYIQLRLVTNRYYKVRFDTKVLRLFTLFVVLISLSMTIKLIAVEWIYYMSEVITVTIVFVISYREMNKRVDLNGILNRFINKTRP